MIVGHDGRAVRLVGFFGSESIGKTSTGYTLTGRLRTHGALAEFVSDSSAAMPFPPDRFDTHEAAWVHVLAKKMEREAEFALRSNVDLIVSDRTPLDLLAYARMKHPNSALLAAFEPLVLAYMHQYDALYFFPAHGTAFRYDQFREPTADSRDQIDAHFRARYAQIASQYAGKVEMAGGTYRERAEFVYHDLLARFFGQTKPKRVVAQLRGWIGQWFVGGIEVVDVRILGSRSVTRAHVASDTDDFDVLVLVESRVQAMEAEKILAKHRAYLESMVEASLDMKVVAREDAPHEV